MVGLWRCRRLRRFIAAGLVGFSILFGLAAWLTAEAMLRPGWFGEGPPHHHARTASTLLIENITVAAPDGVVLRGWFIPHPRAGGRTIVMLHGICGDKTAILAWAELVRAACCANVCLMDLRGHGESGAAACGYGLTERHDVRAVIDHLLTRPDVDPSAVAVAGTSLGGAVAVMAAAEDPRICAVIAEAPFAGLAEAVAERADGHHVPAVFQSAVKWVFERRAGWAWEDVDLRREVARLRCPLLLLHGDADNETPPWHSAELLRHARPGSSQRWLVNGGEHMQPCVADYLNYGVRLAGFWGTAESQTAFADWREARDLSAAGEERMLTDAEVGRLTRLLHTGDLRSTRLEAVSALSMVRRAEARPRACAALAARAADDYENEEVRGYAGRVLAVLSRR